MIDVPMLDKGRVFPKDTFRSFLIVELTSFCPIDEIVLDVSRETLATINSTAHLTVERAAGLILSAKIATLEHLRESNRGTTRIDDFFQRHVRPLLGPGADAEGWQAICLALTLIGQPCEYLLIDYYIRGLDRAVVQNHWNERARCVERFRGAVARDLAR